MDNTMLHDVRIEKLSAEFTVWDNTTPHGKYKVKVYITPNGKYVAYTNIQVRDEDGTPYCGVGHGEDDLFKISSILSLIRSSFRIVKSKNGEYYFVKGF